MALSNKFRLKSNLVTLYGDSNESLTSNDFVPLVMGTNKWTCKQQAGTKRNPLQRGICIIELIVLKCITQGKT